jgi:ATP-binding cassette subfamily F protein uup
MPALTAQHLRKSFGTQVVLDDATFALARGEKVGLIGANGAGKSTLARILAGLEQPDGGTLSIRRGLTVRYLAQEPVLDPRASARAVVEDALTAWRAATSRHAEVTAALSDPGRAAEFTALIEEQAELDDAVLRLGGWDRGHEALQYLHRLGVRDVERPCGDRSGGERRRIALAQLLVASPDVAIVDEPTNHLDADTATWLEGVLADDFPGAVVLVTHDRYFLDAVAQRIVELERGRLTEYVGNYSDYVEKKAELLAHEERVEQNRQNILRREREWLSRGPKARGTKQKARIQRAAALEAKGPATAGRPGEVALVNAASSRQGKTVLELRGVQVAAAPGARVLTDPISVILTAGERIGVVGPNGVGKTTLMRAMCSRRIAANLCRNRRPSWPGRSSSASTRASPISIRRGPSSPTTSRSSRTFAATAVRRSRSGFAVASRWISAAIWSSSCSTRTSSGKRSGRSREASGRASRWRRSCEKAPISCSSTSPRTISICRRSARSKSCSARSTVRSSS